MRQRRGIPRTTPNPSDPHVTGRSPQTTRQGLAGQVAQDPAGRLYAIPWITSGGSGGTGTPPSAGITQAYVDAAIAAAIAGIVIGTGSGGHLHGLQRVLGDGATTTFELLDFAEYLEHVADNGAIVDPATFALSADRSQIVFASAPTAGHVLAWEYVIANA